MPRIDITIRKNSLTPQEVEKFGKDVMDLVMKFYTEIRGVKPGAVWVTFHEHTGLYRFSREAGLKGRTILPNKDFREAYG